MSALEKGTPLASDRDGPGEATNVIPAFADAKPARERFAPAAAGAAGGRADRSIGAILVDAGRLRVEDAERIVQLQREQGLRFGDAAAQLGLLTPEDIEFALSRQFDHPYLRPGQSAVSESVVAAYDPTRPQIEALRILRSQLMLRWFDGERRALAVVSAARREGRSFIAANLAVVFAQLGGRTLLIDADMRHPTQHLLFGLDNRLGLSAMLSGRAGSETIQPIAGLGELSVLPSGVLPPNPNELLGRPALTDLLEVLSSRFDVILVDTSAAGETAEAQGLVVRIGAALVVARRNTTRAWRVQGVSENVAQSKASIVGTILNDF